MAAGSTIITLPDELFEVSESSSFDGMLDVPELAVGPDTFTFHAPLPWKVQVTNTGEGMLLVSGDVEGEATVPCARCLEDFTLILEGQVEGYVFLSDPGDDVPEEMDEDEYLVLGEDRKIDLSTFLKAALVLDAPLVPLHDDDCLGLCPQCGHNLNEGPCACARADEAPADEEGFAKNPFAVLKDFKFDN